MEYVILFIISAVMLGAAVVGCFKPGENDNLCNYDNDSKKEEHKR